MKILIVDDNSDIRSLIRVILESGGHTVVGEAEDGKSALKAFIALRPGSWASSPENSPRSWKRA